MPIEINLNEQAIKTAIRLKLNGCWFQDTNFGCKKSYISHARHLDKKLVALKPYYDNPLLDKTESSPPSADFEINLTEITNPLLLGTKDNTLQIYTDGSVLTLNNEHQAGADIYITLNGSTILESSLALGTMTTINQAELIAIREAAQYVISNNIRANQIHIYTDSLNSLLKLKNPNSTSILTSETITKLNQINQTYNEVKIQKIKAHIGLEGNEKADILAKKGASTRPIGPEPFSFLPNNILQQALHNEMKNKISRKINKSDIKQENKTLLKLFIQNNPPRLAHQNKNDIRNFIQIISGQNHLAHNQNKMDKSVIPFCKHCPNVRETTEHFLSSCPAYSLYRLQVFESPTLPMLTIFEKFSAAKICKFISKTGRMEEENSHYPN